MLELSGAHLLVFIFLLYIKQNFKNVLFKDKYYSWTVFRGIYQIIHAVTECNTAAVFYANCHYMVLKKSNFNLTGSRSTYKISTI